MAILGWHGAGHTKGLPTALIEACAARRTKRIMTMFNTTTLLRLARRQAVGHCGTMAVVAEELPNCSEGAPDPICGLWTKWQKLHQRAVTLCHEDQDLEAQLLRTVGAPMVAVRQVRGGGICLAHSHEDIDAILGDTGSPAGYAEELHRKLDVLEERWSAEADDLAFDQAMQQESEAWAQEAEAANAIFSTSATTLSGIQIKLAFMIETCSVGPPDLVTLVPRLQSAFADVAKLIAASSGRR